MALAMRVSGSKEGDGKGNKSDGNCNKDVDKGMEMALKRAMAILTRVVGKKENDGNE